MTALPKLTAIQLTVLRNTKDGHVYRSERGIDLYSCYDRAQGRKKVTAVMERLSRLGLVQIGDQHVMDRPWSVTKLGDQVLADVDAR